MKKALCALICLLLTIVSLAASAQTVEPVIPDALISLVAGKTFVARMTGFAGDEKMEHVTLSIQLSEQETYKAEEVEALQAGDVICIGGDAFEIKEIKLDEYGDYVATGEEYTIYLSKDENGMYCAVTDTENRFYAKIAEIDVPAAENMRFLDWSDPEAEEPVELTLKDLLTRYLNNEIFSMEYNTEITFDDNGNVSQLIYRYSPWN